MPSETLTCGIPARLPRPQPVLAARALGALGSSRRARLEWRAVGPPLLLWGDVAVGRLPGCTKARRSRGLFPVSSNMAMARLGAGTASGSLFARRRHNEEPTASVCISSGRR